MAIGAHRDHLPLIRCECGSPHRCAAVSETLDELTRVRLEDACEAVGRCREDSLTIGAEHRTGYGPVVSEDGTLRPPAEQRAQSSLERGSW